MNRMEQNMDNKNYRDMSRKAWKLYKLTMETQQLLNQMFFDEFMELDAIELESKLSENADLPF